MSKKVSVVSAVYYCELHQILWGNTDEDVMSKIIDAIAKGEQEIEIEEYSIEKNSASDE